VLLGQIAQDVLSLVPLALCMLLLERHRLRYAWQAFRLR
jgi:hypothetical protein